MDSGGSIGQQSAQRIQNLDVTRGDHIHDSVFYQTSNNQADFVVQNESNGQFQSIIKTISQKFYDGRDADFVIERSSQYLQNFDHVQFSAAKSENQLGDWSYLADLHNHVRINLVVNGRTLASTGSITGPSGGGFTTTFTNCGDR